jgi:hypothetical protein
MGSGSEYLAPGRRNESYAARVCVLVAGYRHVNNPIADCGYQRYAEIEPLRQGEVVDAR